LQAVLELEGGGALKRLPVDGLHEFIELGDEVAPQVFLGDVIIVHIVECVGSHALVPGKIMGKVEAFGELFGLTAELIDLVGLFGLGTTIRNLGRQFLSQLPPDALLEGLQLTECEHLVVTGVAWIALHELEHTPLLLFVQRG